MRISDWSADVCSSDLTVAAHCAGARVKTHYLRAGFGRSRSCACRNILQAHSGDAFQASSPTQGPLSGGPVFLPMELGSKGAERYSASSQRKHAEDESATRQEHRSAAEATNRLQRPGPPTKRICGHATIRPRTARVKRPG